jgi:hypothetical protein
MIASLCPGLSSPLPELPGLFEKLPVFGPCAAPSRRTGRKAQKLRHLSKTETETGRQLKIKEKTQQTGFAPLADTCHCHTGRIMVDFFIRSKGLQWQSF